jgi:tetratricopeptide (TPR) repeat protein
MVHQDRRGLPSGSSSATARDAVETALWRMMSFYDVPLADLDAASAADAGWALPHLMRAGFLLSLTEPSVVDEAGRHLDTARACLRADTPEREQLHLAALDLVHEGRWAQAGRLWDQLLLRHPRDALALQWAHLWDFYRGDALQLRARPARVLPEWDEDDPLRPCVLGLYAFGLEESHEYAAAEDAGRQAVAADPRVPWAVHAVAHVMEMQGRFDAGSAWLRQQQGQWAEGNGFAVHLWWHKALFRLEAMDTAGVLRLVDKHLSGDSLQITLNRVDAAAMLWRLHLHGADVAGRCVELVAGWDLDPVHAGHYAFNDLHAVLALIGAGDMAGAERWVARCAERALAGEDLKRDNHAMAREVGLPLMRGVLAFARGDADGAVDALYPARQLAPRFGGSHAQRDLVDLTLLAAAARGTRRDVGRALLNERRMAKPATPLTRHWLEQLGDSELVRA